MLMTAGMVMSGVAVFFIVKGMKKEQSLEDHLRHFYLIGKTGCGKSTTIRNRLFIPWIKEGYGGMVLETKDKGTIDDILNSIPEEHHDRVIVFDVLDMAVKKKWIGLNLLEDNYNLTTSKTLITGEVMSILKRHFGETAIQARSEDYFRNAILASLDQGSPDISSVYKMLTDPEYREESLERIGNPVVSEYYRKYFSDKTTDLTAPLNKLRAFLSNPLIINVLIQPRGLNIRQVIEEQKILLVLLPKGLIGEDTSRLLASTFLSKAQLAAQSRANIPKSDRIKKPFRIIADEFQDYANSSFNTFLEQSRAFAISLVVAHQLLGQKGIDKDIISSIKGNIGSFFIFRCGIEDSGILQEITKVDNAKEQQFDRKFLEDMANHTYIEKLTVNDKMQKPRHIKNDKPELLGDYAEKLREQSLEKYGIPEGKIRERIETIFADEEISYGSEAI